ncbi:TPA: hypothetical protein RST50_005246 [Klebsiella pneumoniae]|jgi:hypothetical protein|uniref:hypothetical protein n=1 Tax=Klebsiella TaxID=570 RepID=UPI0019336D8A|nr:MULTISPECIES: hypothetical protein [Klebsiella]HDU3787112.1 hypothetical protein [Klebsiella pneumoniae subsp. pneumoniae]EKX7852583.1 hypothetical protein [Klebsiella pneumoniae]MBZ9580450.1 hypothetical protein [Klebsiella quasivariicola]MDM7283158.1 hypothetical protein [Klebsiella pneumoniae]QRF14170.1 hypothetical protein H1X61_08335 [Klebsiella africana]
MIADFWRGLRVLCRHGWRFMLKYIFWINLLSEPILSGHTDGGAGLTPLWPQRQAFQPCGAAQRSEPLNNLMENKIILTSNC